MQYLARTNLEKKTLHLSVAGKDEARTSLRYPKGFNSKRVAKEQPAIELKERGIPLRE